jgi:hypothetical protein
LPQKTKKGRTEEKKVTGDRVSADCEGLAMGLITKLSPSCPFFHLSCKNRL